MVRNLEGDEAERMLASYPILTSGSRAIDALLGGGYKAGRVYEIFGESNTGKTQLAMQAVLMAARGGVGSVFIDTEGTFRPERIEQMAEARGWETGGLLNRISYIRSTSSAGQMEAVARLSTGGEASRSRLVAIDTLTKNFTLELPGAANTPRRQGRLDVHLSEIGRDAFLNGRAYLLANRVTFTQEGRGETHIGGQTVSQMVHASIHLTREGDSRSATIEDATARSEPASIGAPGFD